MKTKLLCFTIQILILIGISHDSWAALVRFESQSLFSARNDVDKNFEAPVYEFFQGSFSSTNYHLDIHTNFGMSRTAVRTFNLYIMDVAYSPIEDLSLRVGRSFNVQTSMRTTATDSAEISYTAFDGHIRLGGMGGIERKTLKRKIASATQFAGGQLEYRSLSHFPFFLGTFYQLRKPKILNEKVNQHIVGGSLHNSFGMIWSPELLADAEYSFGRSKLLNRAEVGIDLYPAYKSAIRLRATAYETKPDDDLEQPIFSLFSLGRLYEESAQVEHQFSKWFTSSLAGAFDSFPYQTNKRAKGYRFEWGTHFLFEFLKVKNSAYFFKSYGGEAYGNRIRFFKDLNQYLQFELASDITYYSKITSAKTVAYNNEIWMKLLALYGFKLDAGVEVNSNNDLRYDYRFAAKLTYLLWSEL